MREMPHQVTDAVLETYAMWAPYTAAVQVDDAPAVESDDSAFAGALERIEALQARIEYFRANPVFPPSRIEQHARETAMRMLADEPEDEPPAAPQFMYADGPLIVAGERVHRRRPEPVEPVVTADCVVEADGLHEHVFEVRVLDVAANEWVYVEVIHDFRSWDANDTEPCDPIVYGRRLGESSQRFATVEAAFAALLPGVSVPAIQCTQKGI